MDEITAYHQQLEAFIRSKLSAEVIERKYAEHVKQFNEAKETPWDIDKFTKHCKQTIINDLVDQGHKIDTIDYCMKKVTNPEIPKGKPSNLKAIAITAGLTSLFWIIWIIVTWLILS